MTTETRWVVYVFENGYFVEGRTENTEFLPELGDWLQPFPNEPGNSTASGLEESFFQSEWLPGHEAWGQMVRIVVSRTKPMMVLFNIMTT
jgi:hypothetical protein